MSTEQQTDTAARSVEQSNRFAPWWVYVLVIVPANLAKEQLLPSDASWPLRAALTAVIDVGGIAVVTALYRAGRESRR
jgi:hypothetical protein